ncbi:MAG: type II 3-dehydroquinate dehydratase [Coriobacteriia bacterium]|nr:type II 3-dehydroquinate dehydratase [Coriobacteriia bacterium]MCL2750205.1 type II 3-dehydroquinate dehydratase [Coriobacteriia bacterium]
MNILIINGPNLNMLGIREPEVYGTATYEDLVDLITAEAERLGIQTSFVQSNCEGALVDAIQGAYKTADGIIINPAAYTHTSIALLDALKAVGIPTIEVHISNPDTREDFRKTSYLRAACINTIEGRGFNGYLDALRELAAVLDGDQVD